MIRRWGSMIRAWESTIRPLMPCRCGGARTRPWRKKVIGACGAGAGYLRRPRRPANRAAAPLHAAASSGTSHPRHEQEHEDAPEHEQDPPWWIRRSRGGVRPCGFGGGELVGHGARRSQAWREWPIRPFLGSHPNRTNWACGSLATRPNRQPNKPKLYSRSLARA
jgi:hypothetical protein